MKVAIISDTHDNLANIKNAINWINNEEIKIIIHCGDIFRRETIEETVKIFKGKIYLVFLENVDDNDFSGIKNVKSYQDIGKLKIENKKIAFCHLPEVAKNLALSQEYDLVFYGHTHKPWEETLRHNSGQETRLINPGNLAGILYKSTFATYNTKTEKLELKILETL